MTKTVSYRGLLLSLLALGVVGMLASGATIAFYGDVERSTGNTFTAGGVELLVDSESHYNNMVCVDTLDGDPQYQWQPEPGFDPGPDHFPMAGTACDGTWAETDLEDGVHKFFNFLDLKPGDFGEDTISLHVYDNPAWGRFLIENVVDADNTCTDPEQSAEEGACSDPDGDGEVDDYLSFTAWVDHGSIPGFQCGETGPNNDECEADPTEGDNIYQETEAYILQNETVRDLGPFELAPILAGAYEAFDCQEPTGDTQYDRCHGFAEDGRMVPSVTYYIGLAWDFPLETGNDAQTDTYQADMVFEVEQHRNNPDPFSGDEEEEEEEEEEDESLAVAPSERGTLPDQQVNFVADVLNNANDAFAGSVVAVSDNGGGGDFFDGTISGECNSGTSDADNEFAITNSKGICYANSTTGSYTLTMSLLEEPGGAQIGDSVDVTVTVRDITALTGTTFASVVGSFTEAWQADGRWGDGGTTAAENEVRIGGPGGGSPIVQAHSDNTTGPWRDGVTESFTFAYDGTEATLTIGDVMIDSTTNPTMIPGADGALGITLKTTNADETVSLANLQLDGITPPTDSASASDGDRAAIVLDGDTELADGFTVTGDVTFSWDAVPPSAESMGILFQVEND